MEPGKTSYRPIRAIGVLLLIEVVGLLAIGSYESLQVDWQTVDPNNLSRQVVDVAIFPFFIPSVVLTFLAALSFLLLRRRGWLLAAIAQGVTLAVCLWLYSLFEPGYIYPVMAYCIMMILYLNSQNVRMMFRRPRRPGMPREG